MREFVEVFNAENNQGAPKMSKRPKKHIVLFLLAAILVGGVAFGTFWFLSQPKEDAGNGGFARDTAAENEAEARLDALHQAVELEILREAQKTPPPSESSIQAQIEDLEKLRENSAGSKPSTETKAQRLERQIRELEALRNAESQP